MSITVQISNCNCIKEANVTIEDKGLNIKYGLNGTGKSTIGNAFKYADDAEQLETLKPFNAGENENPTVSGLPYSKIKVFNEEYVNQYLFKDANFFDDAFSVLLNSNECNELMVKVEDSLKDLHSLLQNDDISDLKKSLKEFCDGIKFKNGNFPRTGGIKDFLKGNGAGFEKYPELEPYRPLYSNRSFKEVTEWAKWRRASREQLCGEICPFCAGRVDLTTIEKQNETIEDLFKTSALSTANIVVEYMEKAIRDGYIEAGSVTLIEKYMGDTTKTDELTSEMKKLAIETEYLHNKLSKMQEFKPMNVTHEQVQDIENTLAEMKVEITQIEKFYKTTKVTGIIKIVNEKIDDLLTGTGGLKGLFNRYEEELNKLIGDRKKDINDLLSIAGFPYVFELKPNGEKKAVAYLVPSTVENGEELSSPGKHLSWGEKNAFAIVMFMFEAISEDADLIILDDPIAAFDTNKKFAVIRRLFDNSRDSFKGKTVLMLTHDLQPIIDYVYLGFHNKYGININVNAMYIQNNDGVIVENTISKKSITNVLKKTEDFYTDPNMLMPVRVVNLRKYIEMTCSDLDNSSLYQITSNLIHARPRTGLTEKDGETPLDAAVALQGCQELCEKLDGHKYDDILNAMSDENLQVLIGGDDDYSKIIALRLKFERNEELFTQLRKVCPSAAKYMNETNHIENDYIFQLDPTKFYKIPEVYLDRINDVISGNS